jgi:hypothetical protein
MLGIYLNDHLARRQQAPSWRTGWCDPAVSDRTAAPRRLAAEIAQDRAALLDIMAALGIKVRRYKVGAAWIGKRPGD